MKYLDHLQISKVLMGTLATTKSAITTNNDLHKVKLHLQKYAVKSYIKVWFSSLITFDH